MILCKTKIIKIWNVNVDNIVISKLIGAKNNSKYLIGYLDNVVISLVLILHIEGEYVKIFKYEDVDKKRRRIKN